MVFREWKHLLTEKGEKEHVSRLHVGKKRREREERETEGEMGRQTGDIS